MNQFVTTANGGMPLYNDDFRFIDSANREALKALVGLNKGLFTAPAGFILWGCNITKVANDISVTEGAIALQGEILYVPAQLFPNPKILFPANNYAFWFTLATSFDPTGNKEYFDASTHDTYQLRRGQLTYQQYINPAQLTAIVDSTFYIGNDVDVFTEEDPTLSEPTEISVPLTLHRIMHGQLYQATADHFLGNWNGKTGIVSYRKDSNRNVYVSITFTNISMGVMPQTEEAIINLPADHRPASGKAPRAFYAYQHTANRSLFATIDLSGDVILKSDTGVTIDAAIGGCVLVFRAEA
jgi:hypothetical protein